MAVAAKNLFMESDNLIRLNGLKDAETDEYVNNATVVAGIYKDTPLKPKAGAAAVDVGGTPNEVDIPCDTHELIEGDKVKILGTVSYDGDYTVKSGTTTNLIRIESAYTVETFTGLEFIHKAVLNADSITLTYVAASDGNYSGILEDNAVLDNDTWYWLIITVDRDEGGGVHTILVIRSKRKTVYYGG